MQVSAKELSEKMGVSKPAVSQWVSSGKLEGCYTGSGRNRRFDLEKCAEALGKRLDPGQMLGNGAQTRKRLEEIRSGEPIPRKADGALPAGDSGRYELARAAKAEEEAKRLRRQNKEHEGTYVLAAEVQQQVARQLAQEVAEFEAVMRDAARRVADHLGVDVRVVRQHLVETWRGHRTARSNLAANTAGNAPLTASEQAEDV